MTDPSQIARGIACKWQVKYGICEGIPDLEEAIAAALREYGDKQKWTEQAFVKALKEADAEGYRRGVEDCILQMHIEVQTLKELSMRNGLQPLESELRGRIEKLRELQRGTGGGK